MFLPSLWSSTRLLSSSKAMETSLGCTSTTSSLVTIICFYIFVIQMFSVQIYRYINLFYIDEPV
ncbi:hypothetical protein BACSTE_01761 [Bacteroides stercoris ATCC 43183]|uniref:Uncharacterized protein n=1 Tax=Bacteroides stercoris ATCC 43183 TaxID=449673 RepID=B0NQW2_BACSE|nr:hypothetical protein BACSTE_01761 [Bacteroides stercoris ATCC 43183]